jgi:6-phosphofructokinase
MTKLEKIGVVGGAGDAEGLHSVIRGVARAAITAHFMRVARALFEGRA